MTVSPGPGDKLPGMDLATGTVRQQTALLRILDANGNRASEGLRVVEDFARFALNDQHLAALSKQLRHELTSALNVISASSRLAVRDTLGDVGVEISEATELHREGACQLVKYKLGNFEASIFLSQHVLSLRSAMAALYTHVVCHFEKFSSDHSSASTVFFLYNGLFPRRHRQKPLGFKCQCTVICA